MDITDKIAIVTGGASGLGAACVRTLAAAGARVAVLDLDEARGAALSAESGGRVLFFKTDVTAEASVQSAVDRANQAFGALHVAISCAGIAPSAKVIGKDGPMPLSHFMQVLQVNLVGTINLIRFAVHHMQHNPPNCDNERGVVINTASAAAFEGQIGQAAYSASKAGVAGMTLPLAREFADLGIRVVSIAPGLFNTPMVAALPDKVRAALEKMPPFPKRLGHPEEFAFLAKHIIENPLLNGETIRLDGGLRMAAR